MQWSVSILDTCRARFTMWIPIVSQQTRTVILTIIGTLVVVGMLQNMRSVRISFVLWSMDVPLSVFLLFIFSIGVVAGLFWRRR